MIRVVAAAPVEEKDNEDANDPMIALQTALQELAIGSDVEGILKDITAISLNCTNILKAIGASKDPAQLKRNSDWLQDQWQRLQNVCVTINKVGDDLQQLQPVIDAVMKGEMPPEVESKDDKPKDDKPKVEKKDKPKADKKPAAKDKPKDKPKADKKDKK